MSRYQELSKEELLKLVEKQEADLKTKYGLVWDSEKEPEQVVLDCENNIPILQRVKEKEIKTDESDDNILIEGDNYHALTCLNYTHKGKIDVIYIDPPYNTGKAKEWIYNDRYIDENDGYRHSKWLNFMEKRLKLARNLLSENGILFISIDDNELYQLKLLMDKLFGENNFINNFMWLHGKGKKTKQSRTLQQYILCYSLNKSSLHEWVDYKFASGSFSNPDNDTRGDWFSGSISFSEERSNKKHQNFFSIKSPSGKEWIRQWQCSEEEMKEYLKDNKIYFGNSPDFSNVPRLKIFPNDINEIIPDNIIDGQGTTRSAQKELDEIVLKTNNRTKFENPKPKELIKYLIKIINKEKTISILDFFAGSGTTWQAVLELNKEDSGNRKFILCTNNELNGIGSDLVEINPNKDKECFGICQRVTYPRLEKVIKGYNKNGNGEFVEELNGNLQYFKTDLIPVERIDNINDQQRHELTEKAGQMIAIKENTFEEIETNEWYQIFENKDKSRKTAIYFREDMDEFESLVKKIGKTKTVLYVFSYSRIDKKIFNYLGKNIVLEDVPEPILEIYKEINLIVKDK